MPTNTLRKKEKYILRLYTAGNTPQSLIALSNLRQLCEEHLAGRYHIEVIDLVKNPERAQDDQILAVPTLVRELPVPIRKFIGNLTDSERVLVAFDLVPRKAIPFTEHQGEAHAC